MKQCLQGIKCGDVGWRVVTQEFPGVQPVLIGFRTHQGIELRAQGRLSRGLLLDNPAGMTGGALALVEHIPDHILIRVTGLALPMVHGTDLPDAQERFDSTDAILCVFHGFLPPSPRECCQAIHGNIATQSRGLLPPSPRDCCHPRSVATLERMSSLCVLLLSMVS